MDPLRPSEGEEDVPLSPIFSARVGEVLGGEEERVDLSEPKSKDSPLPDIFDMNPLKPPEDFRGETEDAEEGVDSCFDGLVGVV